MRKLFIFLLGIVFFVGCSRPKNEPKLGDNGLLSGFESLKVWGISPERGFNLSLNKKFKTQGKYSLKVIYPKGGLPSINTKKLFPDWSNYDYLTFDVFNPQDEIVPFVIRLDDVNKKRVNIEYPLLSGENRVKISLSELGKKIDVSNISFIVLYLNSPNKRITLYFDNMRLVKKTQLAQKNSQKVEHPRLFFTKDDLPKLKEKFNNSPYWLKSELINYADKKNDIFTLGFMYQILGDKEYARKAIDNMLKNNIRIDRDLENFALAFDWCYSQMDEAEKEKIVRKIERATLKMMSKNRFFRSFHNTMYQLTTSIAAAGYALEGESDLAKKFIRFARAQYRDAILMFNNIFVDGGWPEGIDYNRHIAFPMVKYFEMVRTAEGKDLYKECDWLLKNAYFVLYATKPDNTFYRFADNDLPTITDWERRFLVRIASYYKDPYIQWYINNKTRPHEVAFKHIYDVLWYDQNLEEKSPEDLPRAKLFRGLGVMIARSGWEQTDTWLSFKCGDYFGDHNHLDNNAFTIYKLGDLAIDSGLYGDSFASSHWVNYYSRTIAHNSVLIYDPKEKFYGYEWQPLVNDGGQKIMLWEKDDRSVPENYSQPDPSLPLTWTKYKEKWDIGEIKAFKLKDGYCYVVGDATKSYSSHKLKKFTRAILFIFPDYFIIFDKVSSTNPKFKKKWLIHTVNEPYIKNDEIIISENKGNLYWKVILPSNPSINKIGGKGKEFFVDGKNYPHNNKLFAGNVPGNWRVEVVPSDLKKENLFLNFMYASDINGENVPRVKKVESDNFVGVALELKEITWITLFAQEKKNSQFRYLIENKGKIRNLIFNLKPGGKYEVKQSRGISKVINADDAGILDFELENNADETEIAIKLIG